jgi:hypothetical protein
MPQTWIRTHGKSLSTKTWRMFLIDSNIRLTHNIHNCFVQIHSNRAGWLSGKVLGLHSDGAWVSLDRGIGYQRFSWFSSDWDSTYRLGYNFILYSFPFIIQQWFYHSTLCCPQTDSVVKKSHKENDTQQVNVSVTFCTCAQEISRDVPRSIPLSVERNY